MATNPNEFITKNLNGEEVKFYLTLSWETNIDGKDYGVSIHTSPEKINEHMRVFVENAKETISEIKGSKNGN